MRKFTAAAMMVGIALLAGCGGDTPETIKAEIMDNMKEMAQIMEGVTDEASAKAAIPKIKAVREKMRGVAARAKNVKVSEAEVKKLPTGEEMAVMERLIKARAKLDDKLVEILAPALEGMENDM